MARIENKFSRSQSLTIVLIAYVLCIIGGYYSLNFFSEQHIVWQLFWADFVATVIIFIFSYIFRNSSIYDPYWSVIPPFIALFWMKIAPEEANIYRQIVVLCLVTLWSVRLTLNWIRGWTGLDHEDWRYIDIANKTGKLYWLVSFLGIHLMPTILVFLGCLPFYYTMISPEPLGLFDGIATLVTLSAIAIEAISDEQLKSFKKKMGKGLFRSGIWAYSRHPNYFGEVTFWLGLFLFVLQTNYPDKWWMSIGFILMVLLFVFISVPMMDKHHMIKRPGYSQYMEEVSAIVPLPPKRH